MSEQPNIVLFYPDHHRWDWVGYLGLVPVRTPNLDALAKRGVAFTSSYCPSPLCSPSRACLAGGVEYNKCGVPDNNANFAGGEDSLYRRLQDAGYHTMACGKFDLGKPRYSWGTDGKQCKEGGGSWFDDWGFSDGIDNGGKWDGYGQYLKGNACPYLTYLESRDLAQAHIDDFARRKQEARATFATPLPDDAYVDTWIGSNALKLIDSVPGGKPFYLQVNFNGPHTPFDVTESMLASCDGIEYPQPTNPGDGESAERHNEIRRNFAAMIENIDRQVGRVVDHIKEKGDYDNTLFIFSSDHGEMLGDRGRWGKSVPWEASVGVPLLFSGPGVKQGVRLDGPAENLDIAATCVDMAGGVIPESWESRSLRPVLEGEAERVRDVAVSALLGWSVATDGRYKLVRGHDKDDPEAMALFELQEDPGETEDISAEHPDTVARLQGFLQ